MMELEQVIGEKFLDNMIQGWTAYMMAKLLMLEYGIKD